MVALGKELGEQMGVKSAQGVKKASAGVQGGGVIESSLLDLSLVRPPSLLLVAPAGLVELITSPCWWQALLLGA